MAHFRGTRSASGAPGNEPRWTHADQDGVGTAYSSGGRVWFTIGPGILTEAYYPTVDRPQLRDLEFLGKILNKVEFWLPKHPIRKARKGHTLRICAPEAFRLRWSVDNWNTWKDNDSQVIGLGGEYFDLAPADFQAEVEFTFFWTRRGQWAGQNHLVQVQ